MIHLHLVQLVLEDTLPNTQLSIQDIRISQDGLSQRLEDQMQVIKSPTEIKHSILAQLSVANLLLKIGKVLHAISVPATEFMRLNRELSRI